MAKIAIQGNPSGSGTITFQPPNTNTNRTVSLPDVDGTMAVAEQSSVPIGSILFVTGTSAPAGYVAANGQLLDRATYPALWTYANGSGNIVADVSWAKGNYSYGNGTTTFRVPDLRDQFIRGASGTRVAGFGEEDAFQGHHHILTGYPRAGGVGNANIVEAPSTGTGLYTATLGGGATTPSSDGVNGTPRTDDETRPVNVSYLPCIRAYDILINPEVLNAASVVSQVSDLDVNKLNISDNIVIGAPVTASGTAVEFDNIPEGVKRVVVSFNEVSSNGTVPLLISLGTSSGYAITNYKGSNYVLLIGTQGVINHSSAFYIVGPSGWWASTYFLSGSLTFTKDANHIWHLSGELGNSNSGRIYSNSGSINLGASLSKLKVLTADGGDVFDAGTISISWEF